MTLFINRAAAGAELGFFKMAGGGNDFVVIDNRAGQVANPADLTRRICTRRLSVGADGLILVETSARATFRMRYFNSDGSHADFCANGTRCAARFAFLNVIAPRRMTIETDAGVLAAEVHDQNVMLALPPARSFRGSVPLQVGDRRVDGSHLIVGVPHYVLFVAHGLWNASIESLGRAIRRHPDLGEAGANVNFVTVDARDHISVRTYERGVEAETLSCGSGVVASVVTSAMAGRIDSPVSVLTRSGITLRVSFERTADSVDSLRLTGDARVIYRSTVTPETIDGFDPEWVRNPSAADEDRT